MFIKLFSKAKNGNVNFKIGTKEKINKIYLLLCKKVKSETCEWKQTLCCLKFRFNTKNVVDEVIVILNTYCISNNCHKYLSQSLIKNIV